MKRKESGFTLIEIAIVLVIVGLLLGGVLKGQEMIENGKISNLRNDMNGVSAALYAYQDRYHAMPGDDIKANAARGWANATAGNGDGMLTAGTTPFNGSGAESQLMWQHLRYSGLISGDPSGTAANAGGRANPANAYGGKIGIARPTTAVLGGFTGNILCLSALPGKAAASLDLSLDDGNPNAGQVRAMIDTTPNGTPPIAAAAATAYTEAGTMYAVCKKL